MKFQYFLRGVGFGIVFASIIFMVAYNGKSANNTLSDKEIIEKAKEMGMVEEDTSLDAYLKDAADKKKKEKTTAEKTTKSSKKASTEKISEKNTEQENKKESATESVTQEDNTETQTYQITVSPGESSYPICQKLQTLGLIDSAEKFDNFLIENGYAVRLCVGTHTLTKGMSYEEIAIAISDEV